MKRQKKGLRKEINVKKKSVFLVLALITALAIQTPAIGKATPKATPPAQANSGKPAGSTTPQSNKPATSSSTSPVAPGNSGSNSSGSASSSHSSGTSNAGGNKDAQNTTSQNSNDQNSATSTTIIKSNPAQVSQNPKLNPALTNASKANSRAEKAATVTSRASAACQTTTAKGKAQVATDPCSDFIIVFKPGLAHSESANLLNSANAQIKREFSSIFNGAVINGPLSKMQALAQNPNVLVVEDDLEVTATGTYLANSWGLDRIDQRTLPLNSSFNDSDQSGLNSYSYVVDTGIDATNVDFEGRVTPGYTAVLDGNGSLDCNGHGTHVAGIIGGKNYGVAKKTTLIPVRVLDCSGSGSYSSVISGLDWIAANYKVGEAAVVNLSLGGPASSTLDGAIKNLIAKGINVVVAAGNSSADACNYSPSRVTDAITVGATSANDARASYSNFGSCLDIFAPGSSITSTWLGTNGTNILSGTSMASPHVAGIVARFVAQYSGLSPQQVANSLKKSATLNLVTDPGAGSLNALSYLEIVPDLTVAPVDPAPTFQRVNPRGKVIGKK